VTTIPRMEGTPGYRYRVWTVADIPFDDLPRFDPGMRSPAFVSLDDWTVYLGERVLNVHRPGEQHPLNGSEYADVRAVTRAAYEAGVLGLHVYDDVAARYSLPSGEA
jgi:hypothetical protein